MTRAFVRAGVACGLVLTVLLGATATAHEHRGLADHELVVGWSNEPAYAGAPNGVSVSVRHGDGDAVEGAKLEAVVIFGDRKATKKTDPLTLEPAFGAPGTYAATIIPSRPGTYTFHVTGTIEGENVDEYFTSGDATFDDVKDPSGDEFPVRDPSAGQLAQRVTQVEDKADAGPPPWLPLYVAIGALVLALVAFVWRRRRA